MDGFRLFDSNGKGWVSPYELKDKLLEFGAECTMEDVYMFFTRFDKDQD